MSIVKEERSSIWSEVTFSKVLLLHARNPIDIRTITGPKWPVSINLFNHFWRSKMVQKSDTEAHGDMPMNNVS